MQIVKGGRFLRIRETRRESAHSVRPGRAEIGADSHCQLALAVSERIHDDDLALRRAVVHPYGVGVRDVAARLFHRHGGVERQMHDGYAQKVRRLVESGEMNRHENYRKHRSGGEYRRKRDKYLLAAAPEPCGEPPALSALFPSSAIVAFGCGNALCRFALRG